MHAFSRTFRTVAALLVALLVGGSLPLMQACAMGGDMQHHAEMACCCADAPPCEEHAPSAVTDSDACCMAEADAPEPSPLPLVEQVHVPDVLVSSAVLTLDEDRPHRAPPPRRTQPRPAHPLSLHVVHATFLN